MKPNRILCKPETSSIDEATEIRLEGFTLSQLEAFPWAECRNLTSLNLVFCEGMSIALIQSLPRQLSSLVANVDNLDVLTDQVWDDFRYMTKLHLNGKWNSPHALVEAFDQQYPNIGFSFYHPEDDSYHNSFEYRQGKWEFQYFK